MRAVSACRTSVWVALAVLIGALVVLVPAFARSTPPGVSPALDCPTDCNDYNPCTVDACDATTGTCRHDALSCDDANPCTADSCSTDPQTGGCRHVPLDAGTACDDGNSCTQNDACDGAGACSGQALGRGTPCDDGNDCTRNDKCSDTGACVGNPEHAGANCDDGSACTTNDQCVAGAGGVIVCQGTAQTCDDGDPCTNDSCDPATGLCSATPVNCDDGNACTQDACDPATGACVRTDVTGACDDGNFCTVDDACSNGNCVGNSRDCGDGHACTTDTCDPLAGTCRHAGDDSLCPASSACIAWRCDAAQGCVSTDLNGSCDTNPDDCTVEACVNGACQIVGPAPDGTACNDHNTCTTGDACSAGVCAAAPKDCNDNNPCTDDSCDAATGLCAHTNNSAPCDDGNFCTTGDTCGGGVCRAGTALSCDDGIACTADSCDPSQGVCRHAANDSLCPASSTCRSWRCDAVQGCVSTDLNGNCDTDPDDCRAMACVQGTCQDTGTSPDGTACNDHNPCTTGDACRTGQCSGTAQSCDDGNPCTTDSCDPATGACVHTNNSAPCDDHNVCTVTDTCSDGFCGGTSFLNCDDGKDCTIDSCNPTVGCRHAFDARLPDTDADGIPDSCDNCPATPNRLQLDCNGNGVGDACDASLYTVVLDTTTSLGKGSGEVIWTTACETDLRGFNVLMIDNQGNRTRLNSVMIPCSECITGGGATYSTFIPKHKSGRNIFLEVVYRTSTNLVVGPATKQ